ncbi:MAG: hypothetical protein WEB52_05290 [Dehalococcoidia bacterium]
MIRRALVLLLAAAALTAGCGSDDTESQVEIPPLKTDFSGFTDLGKVILTYMKDTGATIDACPDAILQAWDMPEIGEAPRCTHANTDDDPEDEMVIVVSMMEGDLLLATDVVVYDAVPDEEMRIAFETLPHYGALVPQRDTKRSLLSTGDINGDGSGEIVFVTHQCIDAKCFPTVYAVGGRRGQDLYADLIPKMPDDLEPWGVAASVQDLEDDGISEIVIEGLASTDPYAPGSPYRRIYRWDGAMFIPGEPMAD